MVWYGIWGGDCDFFLQPFKLAWQVLAVNRNANRTLCPVDFHFPPLRDRVGYEESNLFRSCLSSSKHGCKCAEFCNTCFPSFSFFHNPQNAIRWPPPAKPPSNHKHTVGITHSRFYFYYNTDLLGICEDSATATNALGMIDVVNILAKRN